MTAVRWLLALVAAAPPLGAAQCDVPGTKVESDRIVIVYRTVPPQVAVGQHFTVEARVCAKGAGPAPSGLRIDADMPAHRHGMNYRAKVKARSDGSYVAEGLLLHMPGHWRLLFDVDDAGRTERLTADLNLE
jgi:hypothetical protein